MSQSLEQLADAVSARFAERVAHVASRCGELTFEVQGAALLEVCASLRDDPGFRFEQLIDVAGVDYLQFGASDWTTESATESGFSRGRGGGTEPAPPAAAAVDATDGESLRFAVVITCCP